MNELIKNIPTTMSSREIAELTNKRHSDILRDIRNLLTQLNGNHNQRMSALVERSDDEEYQRSNRTQYKYLRKDTIEYLFDHAFKDSGYSFVLSEYKDGKGEVRPEYLLTKKDALLLISGYDVVLRANVINRWEELEMQNQFQLPKTYTEALRDLLATAEENERNKLLVEQAKSQLVEAQEVIENQSFQIDSQARELQESAPKVEYHDKVLNSKGYLTVNMIAAELGISHIKLNKLLCEWAVQYKQSDCYFLYSEYREKGYTVHRPHAYINSQGQTVTRQHMYWTESGKLFIISMYNRGMSA
jgi:phage regulator Rha-like protein